MRQETFIEVDNYDACGITVTIRPIVTTLFVAVSDHLLVTKIFQHESGMQLKESLRQFV